MKKINWNAVGGFVFLVAFWAVVVIVVISICVGCASPKVIERTEYLQTAIDSTSVVQMVEARVKSVQQHIDSTMHAVTSTMMQQQETNEQQREHITETITSWVDSLGREVRQEQRVTDRDVSRQQLLREERLVQEFETRLQQAINRQNSEWSAKLEQLRTHFEAVDSSANVKKPVEPVRKSLMDKTDSILGWVLIAGLLIFLVVTRRKWLPMIMR